MIMSQSLPVLASFASYAQAVHLFVASYSNGASTGNVTTLDLAQNSDGTYALSQIATLDTSTNSPSWLTYQQQNKILYLIDEAVNSSTNGTVVSYKPNQDGTLTELSRTKALVGGVSGVLYAENSALAVAHYSGSTLQTYSLGSDGTINLLQTFSFNSPSFKRGAIPARQEAPHPHQALLDPTGQFILVPDLGADQVRIFSIDPKTKMLTPQASLMTTPGYGPRHGVFSRTKAASGVNLFYLVGELSARVTVFKVDYDSTGIKFTNLSSMDTLRPGQSFPANPDGSTKVAPAEIDITPDGSTLLVSNRNDQTFGPSVDSIASFQLSPDDGSLKKLPAVSAQGSFPRHFALNKGGDLLAVGLQNSGIVAVLRKSKQSGLFEEKVASINFPAGINAPVCIVWDE